VSDAEIWQVLDALGLTDALAPRGGLEAMLGERGAGLSGGESRRLALARVLLRRPDILLLDEPTEGLDAAMAGQVLRVIRQLLPQAAIMITTHKAAEQALCTHQFHLKDIN
jgi:ATP-binding cassette subfamily C protein CydC